MSQKRTMAKCITIEGRKYQKKRAIWLGIQSGRGVFKKMRAETLYNSGVMVLTMDDGSGEYFSTADKEKNFSFFFYDMDGQGDEIHFPDREIDGKWQKLFLFLWEDDEEFLLYADRDMIARAGVRAIVGKEWQDIWREALIIASFMNEGLTEKIISIESSMCSQEDTTMSEGELEDGI